MIPSGLHLIPPPHRAIQTPACTPVPLRRPQISSLTRWRRSIDDQRLITWDGMSKGGIHTVTTSLSRC